MRRLFFWLSLFTGTLNLLAQDYATLFIYRKNSESKTERPYTLLINGNDAGSVEPGQRIEYRYYGQGELKLFCTENGSAGNADEMSYYCKLNFEVAKGKNYYLRGKDNGLQLVSEKTGQGEFNEKNSFTGPVKLREDRKGKNRFDDARVAMGKVMEEETAASEKEANPEIVLLSPEKTDGTVETSEKQLKVGGYAKSKYGIAGVLLNGKELSVDENGNFSETVELKQGLNKVSVEVLDLHNGRSSKSFDVVMRPAAEQSARQEPASSDEVQYRGSDPFKGTSVANHAKEIKPGKYYALFIGIDAYSGSWKPLKNAVNDAKALQTLLTGNYKFDVVKTLYNQEAGRAAIIGELEWLVQNVKENDNVLIYYSGHGEFKKELNKGYWVPADAKTASTSNYISNSDIQTFLAGIPSKHTLLISDACFSGDIFRGSVSGIAFENNEKYYIKAYDLKSRQAISSGGLEPVMDGGKDAHSVFAYYTLQALRQNTAKYFDASQLYNRIKIPVGNNSEQSPEFNPIKNTGDEGGNFIFIRK